MIIIFMVVGAALFACGFFCGTKYAPDNDNREAYAKEYGLTNGLMAPVRRGGDRRGGER